MPVPLELPSCRVMAGAKPLKPHNLCDTDPALNSPNEVEEAFLDLEQQNRRLRGELQGKTEVVNSLAREAQSLRDQISQEKEKRKEKLGELAKKLETLEKEN